MQTTWKRYIMPAGLPVTTTALSFLTNFTKFYDSGEAPQHSQRLGVAEALCSNTKNAINLFLKEFNLLEKAGENSQLLAMGLYGPTNSPTPKYSRFQACWGTAVRL